MGKHSIIAAASIVRFFLNENCAAIMDTTRFTYVYVLRRSTTEFVDKIADVVGRGSRPDFYE